MILALLWACAGDPDPCLVQEGAAVHVDPLRAVGTEPFWGATVAGRCVTWSDPETPQGTRIVARYAPGPDGGTWTGTLDGRPFALHTRAAPGCSDGMSDRAWPLAVEVTVGGTTRRGCAGPP